MRIPLPVTRTRRTSRSGKEAATAQLGAAQLVLVAEAGTAGFYIAVTRGLAPVLMAFIGLSVEQVMLVVLAAYVMALSVLAALRSRGAKRLRRSLVAIHGLERITWGLLPLAALLGPLGLVAVYSLSVSLATVSGLLLTTTIFSVFDEKSARRVIAHRSAAAAASNIVGQLTSILVLAVMSGYSKYIYLYVLGSGVGLIATAILAASRSLLPESARALPETRIGLEEKAVSGTVFLYIVAYMASSAVLAAAWAPYMISVLGAPDYLAAGLGFVQMVTSIAASLYWLRVPYSAYKQALLVLPLVPLAVTATREPVLHLGLAGLYAFSATGANLLASFLYADLSRRLGAFAASMRVAMAAAAAQVMGLAVALIVSRLGLWAVFASSTAYAVLAAFIALYSLPEVALVARDQALVHARRLYMVTSAAFGFVVVVSRRTIVAILRLLALGLALLILLFLYRLLYYLVVLPH